MQQGSWVVRHHQIYGFSPTKKTDQQNSGAHFVMLSSAGKKKSAEIRGKTIESAEVHYTFCNVEFCRTIGLNTVLTKFRRKSFFSAEVRYTISVVEFRRKTKKNKVRKKKKLATDSGAQDLNFISIFRRFFFSRSQTPLMPHNRPQRKKGPQIPQRFVWQTNLRLQCKVLSPRPYPTYWPWVAHVIGRNLPG